MTVPRLLTVALLATFVFALLPAPGAMAAPKKVPPGMAVVEGGEFEMGMPERTLKKNWKGKDSTLELLATESPAHKVEIGEFFMDKYEVTNAQYKAFLDDKHKTVVKVGGNLNTLARIAVETLSTADEEWWKAIYHLNWKIINPELKDVEEKDKYPGGRPLVTWANTELKADTQLVVYNLPVPKHWLDHGTFPAGLGDHPVQWMSWDHANQFAAWAGKHLPTEIEWERAARGPKGFVYPWGGNWRRFTWDKKEQRLNWAFLPARHPARDKNPAILTTPVGSFEKGKSPFGMFDMLGNVWEWTDSTFGMYENTKNPLTGKPLEPQDWWEQALVVRGGAYNSVSVLLRNTFRTGGNGRDLIFRADTSIESFGFRCARWTVPGADRAYQAFRTMEARMVIPKEGRKKIVFGRADGIGVEATRYETREKHIFVTGRSRAIAVLPRTKLPVSLVRDLKESSAKAKGSLGTIVGILTTSVDLKVFDVPVPPAKDGDEEKPASSSVEAEGVASAGDYILSFHDDRLQLLLPSNIGSTERAGYLTAKNKDPEAEGPVVLGRHEKNTAWTATGLDEAHIKFAVMRRTGDKKMFVFHAVCTTSEKSILNVDWQIYK